MVPSIYYIWYYTTLLGQHMRRCQLFRDWEPSVLSLLFMFVIVVPAFAMVDFCSYSVNVVFCHLMVVLVRYCFGLLIDVVTGLVVVVVAVILC